MAHPLHHAQSSARKFGGVAADYLAIHDWFDASKAHCALPAHRALRHHAQGIFWAEGVFGVSITNTAGRNIPVRWIGEQHVREDCRSIPTVADWLKHLAVQSWMVNGVLLPDVEPLGLDIRECWRLAVVERQTDLGLREWITQQAERLSINMQAA